MKRIFLLVIYLLSGSVCLHAGEGPLTLGRCREAAREKGNYDALYELISESREDGSSLARSPFLPQAYALGSATVQSDAPNPASMTDFPFVLHPLSRFQYHAGLVLSVPIYSGGRKNLSDAIESLDRDKQKLELDSRAVQLDRAVDAAFLSLLLGRKTAEILDAQMRAISIKLEDVRRAFDAGKLYRNSVLETEAEISALEARILENEAAMDGAAAILSTLTGLDISTDTPLEMPATASSPGSDPGMELLDLEAEKIDLQKRLARAAALPSLKSFGTVGYGKWPLNFFEHKPDFFALVGVSLIIPITDWRDVQSRTRLLDNAAAGIQLRKDAAERSKSVAIQQYDTEIAKYEALLRSGERNVATYEELCLELDRMNKQGVAPASDYLAALEKLSAARLGNELYSILILQLRLQRESYISTL